MQKSIFTYYGPLDSTTE